MLELAEAGETLLPQLEAKPEDFPIDLAKVGRQFRLLGKHYDGLDLRFLDRTTVCARRGGRGNGGKHHGFQKHATHSQNSLRHQDGETQEGKDSHAP